MLAFLHSKEASSRLIQIPPFPSLDWWWLENESEASVLTDGEEQNAGHEAAGCHAQVVDAHAHLCRPQREERGGDHGNHC